MMAATAMTQLGAMVQAGIEVSTEHPEVHLAFELDENPLGRNKASQQ